MIILPIHFDNTHFSGKQSTTPNRITNKMINISNGPLCYNNKFKKDNNIIFHKELYEKGITSFLPYTYVGHLIYVTDKPMDYQTFTNTTNIKVTFINYM